MKKYYIGLIIIGVITLGLAGYVINLGMQSKQDKQTYEKAQDVAETLNDYVSDERKIPESLDEAGAKDVPGTITYQKISSTEYKFCVTYEADKGYGGSDISSTLTGAALTGMYGGDYEISDYESDYKPSSLYIDYFYTKGENCQTIQPRGLSSSSRSRSNTMLDDTETSPSNSFNEADYYQEAYSTYCGANMQEGYESYCEMLEEAMDSDTLE